MVGLIDDSSDLRGAISLAPPCTKPERFGTLLDGEVVHLVVEQDVGALLIASRGLVRDLRPSSTGVQIFPGLNFYRGKATAHHPSEP